jgi:hypothetical protein
MTNDRVFYDPIFDFQDYLPGDGRPGELCDCTIALPDGTQLEAHQILLANSSEFFLNAFTSGMSEQETRTVTVNFNPGGLFPQIVLWMYTGRIEAAPATIMPLVAMARFFGIQALADSLAAYFEARIEPEPELVRQCVRQCYELEMPTALEFLIPTIARNLGQPEYEIAWLSDALDVATFCAVVQATPEDLGRKVAWITEFLGDYALQPSEREALHQVFANRTTEEIELVIKYARNAAWISRDIVARVARA